MDLHSIHAELLRRRVQVLVVGCGGTGSAVAGGLPYLHHYVEFEVKENLRLKERRRRADLRTGRSPVGGSGTVGAWRSIDCTQNC
jgi:hypothetical protein